MPADRDRIPLALYVHLPWCVRKCPYCDFNSHRAPAQLPETDYVDALIRDLDHDLPLAGGRPLVSIFFGGGTPSLFSAEAIQRILDSVRARLPLATDCEITLEANPGAAEQARFAGFRQAGVNRLSIGVQSLNDQALQRLGRIHDAAAARDAVASARAAGFDNFNLDLMYALPTQSTTDADADLQALLSTAPPHVSRYQLTLEPGTAFHARPPTLPDSEAAWTMHRRGARALTTAGLRAYEISAWARPGFESRHNRNYWLFGDYLGIGAGAHGKLTDREGHILRRAKQPLPNLYRRDPVTPAAEHRVAPDDARFEFLMNGLRLTDGFDRHCFETRTGGDWARLLRELAPAMDRGLVESHAGGVRCTALGGRHLDTLLTDLLPSAA
ncbi:radical SAM family heme chaperone HemW [Spectribacter hydrogenoxidans]|uniref:Heme chaperone HemW n=1 Tax=Spectribacter hydrogenoxidans TaxID=3075608 RepID=A0ABU3BWT9_9GAMM|nr:radical SAM family heme chaperone HemW [Salinisphaera sp. W335]MDT0633767.1 radical SAM family heme chaperone HemW [Salinisphaera sp. W335]